MAEAAVAVMMTFVLSMIGAGIAGTLAALAVWRLRCRLGLHPFADPERLFARRGDGYPEAVVSRCSLCGRWVVTSDEVLAKRYQPSP